MQLHPNDPQLASQYAISSLAAGFVGLDFDSDLGDLTRTQQQQLPLPQRDYWAFAHQMAIGDRVLVMAHHFPLAVATVSGDYNYIRHTEPELGVWFRHFRRVEDVKYYADRVTNAASWNPITMTDTISPLHDKNSASYRLIATWP